MNSHMHLQIGAGRKQPRQGQILLLGICLLLGCSPVGPQDAFKRGLKAIKEQDYNLAVTSFSAFLREHPNSVDAYINRGFAYYRKKEYDSAIKDCIEAIKLDPRAAPAYYNRGTAYCGKKQYDKAIPDLTQAIKLHPQADIYATRGDVDVTEVGLQSLAGVVGQGDERLMVFSSAASDVAADLVIAAGVAMLVA